MEAATGWEAEPGREQNLVGVTRLIQAFV